MSREDDARVAELVMGTLSFRQSGSWYHITINGTERASEQGRDRALKYALNLGGDRLVVPHYTTDPAADYQVLEHVREKWEPLQHCTMRDELQMAWGERARDAEVAQVWGPTQYRPGDYSRAALAALDKEQQDGQG